jgi:hypothetical protein
LKRVKGSNRALKFLVSLDKAKVRRLNKAKEGNRMKDATEEGPGELK